MFLELKGEALMEKDIDWDSLTFKFTETDSMFMAFCDADGEWKEKGIVPPEDCIKGKVYDRFMKELKKRNINILEVIEGQQ